MMNRMLSILPAVFALCISCGGERGADEPAPDTVLEVGYAMGTRGGEGAPADKDTYTIISYRVAELNGTPTSTPYIAANLNYRGHYVYLEEGNKAFVEENFLVPTEISNVTDLVADYPYRPRYAAEPVRNNTYGQKLYAGRYKTAVLHPAAVVLDCNEQPLGSFMAVLPRNIQCPVYAPMPGGLFEMTVEHNLAVYEIETKHTLRTTMAMMKAFFYSSPDVEYKIESVRLLNMGSSGWFNPFTGITYPNYGPDPRVFSLLDSQIPAEPAKWRVSAAQGDLGYVSLTGEKGAQYLEESPEGGGEGIYPVHYMLDEEPVFATDYRGQSDGGEYYQYVKTIVMRITVSMPVPDTDTAQQITADIPVSLKIDRGKLYNFYFDVRSGIFSITYSIRDGVVNGWDEGNSDTGDVPIGGTIEYGSFDFKGGGGWVFENGGEGEVEIGGANP